MMEPGVVECVLNGIALLFVVTFDEKLFTLMVNKDHTTKFTMEMAHAHNRDAIFEYLLPTSRDFFIFIFCAKSIKSI